MPNNYSSDRTVWIHLPVRLALQLRVMDTSMTVTNSYMYPCTQPMANIGVCANELTNQTNVRSIIDKY